LNCTGWFSRGVNTSEARLRQLERVARLANTFLRRIVLCNRTKVSLARREEFAALK